MLALEIDQDDVACAVLERVPLEVVKFERKCREKWRLKLMGSTPMDVGLDNPSPAYKSKVPPAKAKSAVRLKLKVPLELRETALGVTFKLPSTSGECIISVPVSVQRERRPELGSTINEIGIRAPLLEGATPGNSWC